MKEVKLTKPYNFGPYDESDEKEQWIRITEGCVNQCPFCAEPAELKIFNIPKIVRNDVKLMDMNLLCKPEALSIINKLGSRRVNGRVVYYEAICGFDYRFLTQGLADAIKAARFRRIRIAWDFSFGLQYKIKDAIGMFLKAGYSPKDLMVFMICNWKTTYAENCQKLELCKVWNVKVGDCWFDNQLSPNIKPIYWTVAEIKDFRAKCRKHNQLVNFKVDPEWREVVP